jgi:hypothetical protein
VRLRHGRLRNDRAQYGRAAPAGLLGSHAVALYPCQDRGLLYYKDPGHQLRGSQRKATRQVCNWLKIGVPLDVVAEKLLTRGECRGTRSGV